jgi:hypothetical protein
VLAYARGRGRGGGGNLLQYAIKTIAFVVTFFVCPAVFAVTNVRCTTYGPRKNLAIHNAASREWIEEVGSVYRKTDAIIPTSSPMTMMVVRICSFGWCFAKYHIAPEHM